MGHVRSQVASVGVRTSYEFLLSLVCDCSLGIEGYNIYKWVHLLGAINANLYAGHARWVLQYCLLPRFDARSHRDDGVAKS